MLRLSPFDFFFFAKAKKDLKARSPLGNPPASLLAGRLPASLIL
jgi:hypothetical protein